MDQGTRPPQLIGAHGGRTKDSGRLNALLSDDFAKRRQEILEAQALQDEIDESQRNAEVNQEGDDDEGILSRSADMAGDFLGATADAFTRGYREMSAGANEFVDDLRGTTEDNRQRERELGKQRQEALLAASEKLKDPMLSSKEREDLTNFIEMMVEDSNQESQDAQESVDMTDPLRQAANVASMGVDVLSGGSLTGVRGAKSLYTAGKGVRGARTGRLAKAGDIAGYQTAKGGAVRGGAEATALGASESAARQYATNDGEIDPKDFLIDTVASAGLGGVTGAATGAMSARQAGKAARGTDLGDGVDGSATRAADDLDAEDAFINSQRNQPTNQSVLALDTGEARARRELAQIDEEIEALQNGELPTSSYTTGSSQQLATGSTEQPVRGKDLFNLQDELTEHSFPTNMSGTRIENTGDIFRELAKSGGKPRGKGYMGEKLSKLRKGFELDEDGIPLKNDIEDILDGRDVNKYNAEMDAWQDRLRQLEAETSRAPDGPVKDAMLDTLDLQRDVAEWYRKPSANYGGIPDKITNLEKKINNLPNAGPDDALPSTSTNVGTLAGEGTETLSDAQRTRREWKRLQARRDEVQAELARAQAPNKGQYTARISKRDVNTPGQAQKKAAKEAEKRIEAIPNTGYKGAATDTITSFLKSLHGGLWREGGSEPVSRAYEKIVGGLATRNEARRLMSQTYNKTIEKSNRWKRRNGVKVGDALRRVSDEDMADLTTSQIANKYRLDQEVVDVAKKTRRHFQEMLDQTNEARMLRGQEPIPYRSEYMPQWMKQGSTAQKENRFISTYIEEFQAKFSQQRVGNNRDYEKNVFKVMDEYHSQVANEVELTPIIRHLNELAEGVEKPIMRNGQQVSPGNVEGANWIRRYISEGLMGSQTQLDAGIIGDKGNIRNRITNRLIMARSLSGLAGNVRWMLVTQPQTAAVTVKEFGWRNTFRGAVDAAFDPNVRRQIQDLEIYRMKRSQSVGATAGGQLDRLSASVMKSRREFANDLMTAPSNYVESALDSVSAAAAMRQAKKLKLDPQNTRNMMNHGIEVTQSVYSAEMRPQVLRSAFVRAGFPFQTYSTEMWRHVRNLTTGSASGMKFDGGKGVARRAMMFTNMVSAIALGNYLQKQVTGQDVASPGSMVPLAGSQVDAATDWVTNEFDFLPDTEFSFEDNPPITAFEQDFTQLWDAAKGFVSSDDDADMDKARKVLVQWGMGLSKVGGASTVNRWIDSAIAFNQGYIESGDKQIELEPSPGNIARGMTSGVWSTPEGQAHIEGDRWSLSEDQYANVTGENGEAFEAMYSEMRNISTERRKIDEEISKIANEGNINKARRMAIEFNQGVDERLQPVIDMYGLTEELIEAIDEYKVGEEIHHIKRRVD